MRKHLFLTNSNFRDWNCNNRICHNSLSQNHTDSSIHRAAVKKHHIEYDIRFFQQLNFLCFCSQNSFWQEKIKVSNSTSQECVVLFYLICIFLIVQKIFYLVDFSCVSNWCKYTFFDNCTSKYTNFASNTKDQI
jgi:hypothetical protein